MHSVDQQVCDKLYKYSMYTLRYLANMSTVRKMKPSENSQDMRYYYSRARRCSGPHWRESISYSTVHSIPGENTSRE